MIRMYPGGLRQDSSNANPVDAWNYGIQMAALNFQNEDHIMPLCYGKFLDNGGCGYVLKPNYLTHARETGYNPLNPDLDLDESCTLTLKIISAQFLSRLNQSKSDVPDPYVTVSIHGLPCDQQSQKTAVIENNGLDPQWYEKFTFQIRYPQMALVYFSIYDYNAITADERLAHFCLPLTMMQTGYRHVRLRADNNDLLHSTLFVRVEIRKDGDHIISTRL
jgi:phosphatidylinositol phospholipase C delta